MLRQNPAARGEYLIIIFEHFYPSCSGYGVSNSLRPFAETSFAQTQSNISLRKYSEKFERTSITVIYGTILPTCYYNIYHNKFGWLPRMTAIIFCVWEDFLWGSSISKQSFSLWQSLQSTIKFLLKLILFSKLNSNIFAHLYMLSRSFHIM